MNWKDESEANLKQLEEDEMDLQEIVDKQMNSLEQKLRETERRRAKAAIEDEKRLAMNNEAVQAAAREAMYLRQAQQLRDYTRGVPVVEEEINYSFESPGYQAYFPDGRLVPDGPVSYWDARTLQFPDSSDDE